MSWTIPAETKYSHQKRSKGIVVFAIQRALNDVMAAGLSEDGHYGSRTEGWAATFQEDHNLYADGIFGPASSQQMARNLEALVTVVLPERLIEGFVEGESGGHIGAVNWSVAGGVDCSYLQRRVLDGSDEKTKERAFDGRYQFTLMARTTRDRYRAFFERRSDHSTQIDYIQSGNERSWRLAALAHNWPYAADRLSWGHHISSAPAPWVPDGTTFQDGTYVKTFWDWARYYALGAPEHNHRGSVTRFVTDWSP
jgi:hypothetical protein